MKSIDKRLAAIENITRASKDPIAVVRPFLSTGAPSSNLFAVRGVYGGYIERDSGQPIFSQLARHAEQKP